jgi:hypothetical protein
MSCGTGAGGCKKKSVGGAISMIRPSSMKATRSASSRANPPKKYSVILSAVIERFLREFGGGPIDHITLEHVLTFLNRLNCSTLPYTKQARQNRF